jgi:hypothetical protein
MGVETRRSLERSDIEFVRIFERDFGFVRDGLGHGNVTSLEPWQRW